MEKSSPLVLLHTFLSNLPVHSCVMFVLNVLVGGKRAFSRMFGSRVRFGKSRRYLWARSRGRGCSGLMLLGEIFVLNTCLVSVFRWKCLLFVGC